MTCCHMKSSSGSIVCTHVARDPTAKDLRMCVSCFVCVLCLSVRVCCVCVMCVACFMCVLCLCMFVVCVLSVCVMSVCVCCVSLCMCLCGVCVCTCTLNILWHPPGSPAGCCFSSSKFIFLALLVSWVLVCYVHC